MGQISHIIGWFSEHLEESIRASWRREHSCQEPWSRGGKRVAFQMRTNTESSLFASSGPRYHRHLPYWGRPHRQHIELTNTFLLGLGLWLEHVLPSSFGFRQSLVLANDACLSTPVPSLLISWRWTPQSSPVNWSMNHFLVGQRLVILCNNIS